MRLPHFLGASGWECVCSFCQRMVSINVQILPGATPSAPWSRVFLESGGRTIPDLKPFILSHVGCYLQHAMWPSSCLHLQTHSSPFLKTPAITQCLKGMWPPPCRVFSQTVLSQTTLHPLCEPFLNQPTWVTLGLPLCVISLGKSTCLDSSTCIRSLSYTLWEYTLGFKIHEKAMPALLREMELHHRQKTPCPHGNFLGRETCIFSENSHPACHERSEWPSAGCLPHSVGRCTRIGMASAFTAETRA